MKKVFFLALSFLVFISSFAQQNDFKNLDKYLEQARIDWQVPGMAVGIIKGDSILFAKGYGVKNIKFPKDSVDVNTLFPIASNTKSFTATALAMLVDQGKISWDDKVVKYLPYFELYDPYVTKEMTIRDLLGHHSGLKTFSGDLLWYGSIYSRQEVIKRARFLTPIYGFRTKFGYSNIMYIAAGEIVEKVSGMSWDEFIKQNFFQPLGMNSSNTSFSQITTSNKCQPHNIINDSVFPIEWMNWDNIGGAGAINSNVSDMLKYLKLQAFQGSIDNKMYFSQKQADEMATPNTNFSVTKRSRSFYPSTHFKAYGMGWNLMDYHGRMVMSHSGGYDGVITFTCVIPEEKIGFVILTNMNSSLYNALSYKILDFLLSNDTTNWSQKFLPYQKEDNKREEIIALGKPSQSLNLKSYCGKYHSEVYGDVLVKMKNKNLEIFMMQSPIFSGSLTQHQGDTFLIKLYRVPSLPQGKVYFTVKEKGGVEKLKIEIPNPDFYFDEFEFLKDIENPKMRENE